MKRKLTTIILFVVCALNASGQKHYIAGTVTEDDTHGAVCQATVQLLRADSSYVCGTVTSETGAYRLPVSQKGKYIVRISFIGCDTKYCNTVFTGNDDIFLHNTELATSSIMLKGAEVTANIAKVTVTEDTLVYNADAYRTPEGSALEELVKLLPGAKIDDDDKITINGKEVTKILVDGKEFFTGDTKTAIKNIPTSMIEKIKAYEQKSDLAKVTGIDDGEEQMVLDLGVKPGQKRGIMTNNDVGIGTDARYFARVSATKFTDKLRVMAFGNANNTNDKGYAKGGKNNGRQGLNASKMAGVNFNYHEKDKLQMDGSVRWNHGDADTKVTTSAERFASTTAAFSNSNRSNMNRSDRWNANMRLEWKPDTMTDIMMRPSINFSDNDGFNAETSASYNENPNTALYDMDESGNGSNIDSIIVNSHNNISISNGHNKNLGVELQYNRKLSSTGRNITARATAGYGDNESKSISLSNVHLYKLKNAAGLDSAYQTNRFNSSPGKNWNYSLQATYSEPIMKATFLQLSYKFQYSYSKSDRATYDFSNLGEAFFDGISPGYGLWNEYLDRLQNPMEDYRNDNLSRFSEYKNYTQNINLSLRMVRKKYNLSLGLEIIPQKTYFIQEYHNIYTDTMRCLTNISPTMDFKYRFSKMNQLRLSYHGYTSQPSITSMLDITDDSNPLNITKGNPGLKPSYTNNLRLVYNNYIKKHQRTVMANMNLSTTSNSISNMVEYNDATGGRTTRPENINGNWNASGMFLFNTAIDSAAYWNISTATSLQYNHYAAYLTQNKKSSPEKNITETTTYGEDIDGGFRNKWLEFEINGNVKYTDTNNKLQSSRNMSTWQFSYGISTNINLPWNMRIATDISENSRRGFSDAAMNTNELIWNAQISQSLLKNNKMTISIQLYDILGKQSNFSRTINAYSRNDTEYNAITSYAMLHVIYRFKQMGRK